MSEILTQKLPIFEKIFLLGKNKINKPLIDDRPYSEKDAIRAYTETDKNYIEWLIENAKEDHCSAIRNAPLFTIK